MRALLLAPLLAFATAAAAQEPRPLALRADAESMGATLTIGPVLGDHELADAVLSGVPIRLRLRAELWRDAFFDELVESTTLTTVVVYEPLTRRYFVRSTSGDLRSRVFPSYEAARAAVERDYPLHALTRRAGNYYFTAALDIETLSVSDLQELERWLQGDLQPAVSGGQSLPGAVGEGARRLLIRVLGVPNRQYEARSNRFRIGPEPAA
ncbi:MAG: DUF4390 domain-containing protein [Gemmatimonadetes bacterium]|nr:DUF4390 domain-containing protein [Gemmatimonadota bacterium]